MVVVWWSYGDRAARCFKRRRRDLSIDLRPSKNLPEPRRGGTGRGLSRKGFWIPSFGCAYRLPLGLCLNCAVPPELQESHFSCEVPVDTHDRLNALEGLCQQPCIHNSIQVS